MNHQQGRTLQEVRTTLAPAAVLEAAKRFFTERPGIYAAWPEKEGPTYVNLRGQGGEEILIGVAAAGDGVTRVTGSTYLLDMQVARFLGTLPPAPEASPIPESTAPSLPSASAPDAAPPGGAAVAPPTPAASAGGSRPGGSPA